MRALAWFALTVWAAVLAATDLLLATCRYDCSDSGAVQGLLLLALLAPAVVIATRKLLRTGLDAWSRRALLALGFAATALTAWLIVLFV
jgi:hypothetical protein